MEGTIKAVLIGKGFGFIEPADGGQDVFFHFKELHPSLDFDETLTERRVQFEQTTTGRGPRARNVRPAD